METYADVESFLMVWIWPIAAQALPRAPKSDAKGIHLIIA
jgi:hypothetical protein